MAVKSKGKGNKTTVPPVAKPPKIPGMNNIFPKGGKKGGKC